MFAEIRNGLHSPLFDLTGDGLVDSLDVDELVLNILGTLYGDANLDRTVDGLDFILWNANKFQAGGWRKGDFNGDAIVAGTDFIAWNQNKFQSGAGGLGIGPKTDDPMSFWQQHATNSNAISPGPVRTHSMWRLPTPIEWAPVDMAQKGQLAAWQRLSMLRQTDDTTNTRNHDKREVPLGTDLAGQLDCLKPSLPAKADEKR